MPVIRIVAVFSLLLIGVPATGQAATDELARPNILFIAVDDLRPMGAAFDDTRALTPSIDALAAESTVFRRAYVQYPVCGPSRSSMLTGLRPESSGVLNLKTRLRDIHPDIVTLPQFFKNEGYATAAVGKIFDPRNVDSRQDDDPASWTIPFKNVSGKVDRKGTPNYAAIAIDARNEDFIDGQIHLRGKKLLRQMARDDRPFFLGVGYKKPHLPFTVPRRFYDLYDRDDLALEAFQKAPAGSDPRYILSGNNELRNYVPHPSSGDESQSYGDEISAAQQKELLHGYFAAVSFIDELVGDLLDELVAVGAADDTIVVLWGDHGFHLGDHGVWGKHTTMEQAARHPLIIRAPGREPAAVDDIVEALDIYPTLLELAGYESRDDLQGRSLVDLIDGQTMDDSVAITMYRRLGAYGYSLRTDRYRYTQWIAPDGSVRYRDLYDMQRDPGERTNIALDPANGELLDALAALLREHDAGLLRLQGATD
jgi:arylsulfatase A-like enzyme